MKKEKEHYYLEHPDEPEPTLVYYYYNPDSEIWGFGFNIADGGGFLPEDDLGSETTITRVEIISTYIKKIVITT